MPKNITLKQLDGAYAVSRVSHLDKIPDWVDGEGFVSINRTDDELSIVCLQNRVPANVTTEFGWACFKFLGPFEFDDAGVLLSVIRPLSESGMGVFAISTYNGDTLLLKKTDVGTAVTLLKASGHSVEM